MARDQSFLKRQRERERQQKKVLKAQRKAERREKRKDGLPDDAVEDTETVGAQLSEEEGGADPVQSEGERAEAGDVERRPED